MPTKRIRHDHHSHELNDPNQEPHERLGLVAVVGGSLGDLGQARRHEPLDERLG